MTYQKLLAYIIEQRELGIYEYTMLEIATGAGIPLRKIPMALYKLMQKGVVVVAADFQVKIKKSDYHMNRLTEEGVH